LFWRGELGLAHTHAQHGLALYDPQQMRAHALRYGQDSGVTCRLFGALCLWLLGYPDQARQGNEAALTHAQELLHAYTLGSARANVPRPAICWRRSTTGSPRALTPLTSRRPKGSSSSWREVVIT
jgi:hypothetical protein